MSSFTVVSTGLAAPADANVMQAAHDGSASGGVDTILLKQMNPSTPFDFGTPADAVGSFLALAAAILSDGDTFFAYDAFNPLWLPSTAYKLNEKRANSGNVYRCVVPGTSASSGGPSGTSPSTPEVDGTAQWLFFSSDTYEFDVTGDGVAAGNNLVLVDGGQTAQQVSDLMVAAVTANIFLTSLRAANGGTTTVTLTNSLADSSGNVTNWSASAGGMTVVQPTGGFKSRVTVTKGINWVGVGKPTIKGGFIPFLCDISGQDSSFKNLLFKDVKFAEIAMFRCGELTIDNVDKDNDTTEGLTLVSTVDGLPLANTYAIGDPTGSFVGDLSGNVTIQNCSIDFESKSNPADPYAGTRAPIKPNSASSIRWRSIGPAAVGLIPVDKKMLLKNNHVKNYSGAGFLFGDQLGRLELSKNTFETPYGASPFGLASLTSIGVLHINGISLVPNNLPVLFSGAHGKLFMKNNEVTLLGDGMSGLAYQSVFGFPPTLNIKAKSVSITNNKVVSKSDTTFACIDCSGVDSAYIANNKIEGTGFLGILYGFFFSLYGTNNGSLVNNRLHLFTPVFGFDIFVTADANNTTVKGSGLVGPGGDGETVLNLGAGSDIDGINEAPKQSASIGTVDAVAKAALATADTFFLDDGLGGTATLELDKDGDGVVGGNVVVDVSGDTTKEDVAKTMIMAINGAGLNLKASTLKGSPDRVDIANKTKGSHGDVTTWTATNAGMTILQPTGGVDSRSARIMESKDVSFLGFRLI